MKLFKFHFAQMPLEKTWINLQLEEKFLERSKIWALLREPIKEKENSDFKPAVLC